MDGWMNGWMYIDMSPKLQLYVSFGFVIHPLASSITFFFQQKNKTYIIFQSMARWVPRLLSIPPIKRM